LKNLNSKTIDTETEHQQHTNQTATTNNNIENHENQNFINNHSSQNGPKPNTAPAKSTTVKSTSSSPNERCAYPKPNDVNVADETVYDNSGVDTFEFIKKTLLENPSDRSFMLSIENSLIDFLNDK
jgi:hypothetical protein